MASLTPTEVAIRKLENAGAWISYVGRKRKLIVYHDGEQIALMNIVAMTTNYKGVDTEALTRVLEKIDLLNERGRGARYGL